MSQKSIHVVYIITKLELGGAQKVCLNLYERIQKSPHFNASLISGTQGPLVEYASKNANTILLDSFKREISGKAFLHEIKTFFALIKTLRSLKKQHPNLIVHTHSTKAGLLGRWAALFAGIKMRVHTVHGYGFHNHQSKIVWFIIYLIELMTSFITTHFVCVSSQDVKMGLKLFPRFTQKHSIIRAAIDWHQFIKPARKHTPFSPHDPFIVGTVACFKPQKNLFDLLRAFETAYHTEPRLRLEIVGDGSLRYDIEHWILTHNLNNVITLHGWQDEVAPIMKQWHAFVLTSLWEGLPCALIEARVLKLPVICYDTGGIHDVIQHEENGLLYEQKDWHGVAQGMISLAKEQQLYTKLQQYPDDLTDFRTESMIAEHILLYKNLMH